MIKSLHLLLGPPGDLLPADIFSLEILTNLSASILVSCSSHSLLLSTHSLIGWISQDSLICWLFTLFIFVLPTIFHSTFISCTSNLFQVFDVSDLVSSAYVLIVRTVALYISYFVYGSTII